MEWVRAHYLKFGAFESGRKNVKFVDRYYKTRSLVMVCVRDLAVTPWIHRIPGSAGIRRSFGPARLILAGQQLGFRG